MKTLVISDLHLGARGGRALLHSPEVRATLATKLEGVDRLVLLGDVVELREDPVWTALANAAAVIDPLARALSPQAEVVLVPGNHDHELLAPWLVRRASGGAVDFELDAAVDWRPGEPLARMVDLWGAGGATVRVSYPGVWLRDDTFAMHGHYLDRHSTLPAFERLAAGAMAKYLKEPLASASRVEDYESVLGPIYAWMFAVSQTGHRADPDSQEPGSSHKNASARIWRMLNDGDGGLAKLAISGGISAATGLLSAAGLGPLKSEISGEELYRTGVRGYGAVLQALGVDADYALYGHTHRAGPLPGDEVDFWTAPSGTKLINTGCWVSEEAFLGPDLAQSAYRAGFGVRLDSDFGQPPRLVNLLERDTALSA